MKGYGFKTADQLTARFLNNVNDTVAGGTIFALPAPVQPPPYSATQPGDAIIVDDAIALALSDTVGTGQLFGGIYMYVGTFSGAAASPGRGTAAFWRAADIPTATVNLYQVSSDAQPSTTLPTLWAGVFINAVTKGNFGWIQLAGVASCLFDSAISASTVGGTVFPRGIAGVAATVASTFDVGAAVATPASVAIANAQIIGAIGVAIVLPVVSTITTVMLTRSPYARV